MSNENIFYIVCGIAAAIMLLYYVKRKDRITSFMFGGLSGFIALLLLNKYGAHLGVTPQINLFNTIGSTVLGVPYVIAVILIEKI